MLSQFRPLESGEFTSGMGVLSTLHFSPQRYVHSDVVRVRTRTSTVLIPVLPLLLLSVLYPKAQGNLLIPQPSSAFRLSCTYLLLSYLLLPWFPPPFPTPMLILNPRGSVMCIYLFPLVLSDDSFFILSTSLLLSPLLSLCRF